MVGFQFYYCIYLEGVSSDCSSTVDITLYILEHASMHCSTACREKEKHISDQTRKIGHSLDTYLGCNGTFSASVLQNVSNLVKRRHI